MQRYLVRNKALLLLLDMPAQGALVVATKGINLALHIDPYRDNLASLDPDPAKTAVVLAGSGSTEAKLSRYGSMRIWNF